MGELQGSQPLESMSASSPSQAIVDVVENMRAKVHALFCKIGYTELPGMSTEDYVTLTIIEQYLNLKVWSDEVKDTVGCFWHRSPLVVETR